MSWTTNVLKKYLTGAECETFDDCVARLRHAGPGLGERQADRVEQLEGDLARAVLLIHTLAEACIAKGVFTRNEIAQAAAETDLLDGTADGKLDPAAVRPRQKRKPPVIRGQ